MHPANLQHAISHLLEEHRATERVLRILDTALKQGDASRVSASLAFLEYVVDRVHHAKEEDALFTKLVEVARDVEPATIETLQKQHTHGRSYLRAAEALLDDFRLGSAEAKHALVETIRAYERYSVMHMKQEERVIFPLAVRLLGEAEGEVLLEHFMRVQSLLIPTEQYDAYMAFSRRPEGDATASPPWAFAPEPPTEAATTIAKGKAHRTRGHLLYEDEHHRVERLRTSAQELGNVFVITNAEQSMILDPDGPVTFPAARAGLAYVFLSHHGPGIDTSINAWIVETDVVAVSPEPLARFLTKDGLDPRFESRCVGLPDAGGILALGGTDLAVLPAHFLPHDRNLQLFDPRSKILFSGELGSSEGSTTDVVDDFDAHVPRMIDAHRRSMANRSTVSAWVTMIEQLDVRTIAPRRGAIFEGQAVVSRFLEWCKTTECGTDLIAPRFELPTHRVSMTNIVKRHD